MTDENLHALAEAAGIALRWRDVHGEEREVSPETLRAVLGALGLSAGSEAASTEARALLSARATRLPPLLTATTGDDGVAVPGATPGHRFRLVAEDDAVQEGRLETGWSGEARLPALRRPGYHRLELDAQHALLAVAPPRCFGLDDLGLAEARPWALAAQIYSLRRAGDAGIGDFGGVAALARAAARQGVAALAISPAHAMFAADPDNYGPYAPSSRLFLNLLHADPSAALGRVPPPEAGEDGGFIDWPAATARKLAWLRRLYGLAADHPDFTEFRSEAGPALEDHARFEALHAHMFGQDPARWHWRDWPEEFRSPQSTGVQRFVRDHAQEVAFHAFCQWLADASRGAAQRAARDAGMAIGLISDLAVGTNGGGSQAWSRQAEILSGVTVGAPPDVFSPLGQDWGLTAFSPLAMSAEGFGAFRELLTAAFRHAGGVRIDHAMGLQRLWVVPQGAKPEEGAYLHYPVTDLLRLLALESHRHRAIVIGEDLGTLPEGFHDRMERAGILGMRVLWFEHDQEGRFRPPRDWSREAAAMTTTHDLPTVVGWWRGLDIEWRERLSLFPSAEEAAAQREQRAADRAALWRACLESGAATGDQPAEEDTGPVLDAALAQVAGAASRLAILPLEDALGLAEQPNLPGTTEGHPNWQRRLPGEAGMLLDAPEVARRLRNFALARDRGLAG